MSSISYDKQIQLAKAEKERQETLSILDKGFQVADVFTNKQYLDNYSDADILSYNKHQVQNQSKLRIYQMTKIVFDKDENALDKLTSVYNALYNLSVSVAIIIIGSTNSVKFYFATRSEQMAPLAGKILESTLVSNFPGIELVPLDGDATLSFLNEIDKGEEGQSLLKGLSTVSLIPCLRDAENKDKFVQGMEKFINTLRGKTYTAFLLATPLNNRAITIRKHGYEELYSTLSPHAKLTYSYGENVSHAVNKGVTHSFTKSMNESVSNSNSSSDGYSTGTSSGTNSGSNFGNSFSSDGFGMNWSDNSGTSESTSSSYTSSTSFSHSISNSVGKAEAESETSGETDTTGSSETKTLNYENKGISDLLKRIEEQLERINEWESYGLWENCAYFFSEEISVSVLAATTYKALMIGEKSGLENAHVNVWKATGSEKNIKNIRAIMDNVKYLVHPSAEVVVAADYKKQIVTPTTMVSGSELSLLLGLPRKSVAGVAVQEMAEFGRSVVYENKKPVKSISIGNVYHMGIEEKNTPVDMDLELFSSHCFITGSSGSGKSYATYNLLDRLIENDIKILVVEPAKGEYKMVFGNLDKVNIFSTDANTYRLLRINPFQFPNRIHILSHIEQLLQIFNASWPLYAAMPAILKEAVVKAYIMCGWDVQNSIWIEGISNHKYPVFEDVLKTLPEIINTSDYSADSKGDYKGALLTRVQAMTTGLNGLIFKNSEGIKDEVLFDQHTIVDLSEVGSDETIALIMGVLIMRLNEYRKSQRKTGYFIGHDSQLKHITVLEEAHNLLKRTNKDQNQEGANMIGKSVEMISNSIKEMRTYGEGFLIIDQSPLAVDSSVIENTSTKIIMNMPSKDACDELGSSLSLKEEQTKELSRLNVGIAAVMQKGWMMPVLMKVGLWNPTKYEAPLQYENAGTVAYVKSCLVNELCSQIKENKFAVKSFGDIIRKSNLDADRKSELAELTELYKRYKNQRLRLSPDMIGNLMLEIIGCGGLFEIIPISGLYSDMELNKKIDSCDKQEKQELYSDIIAAANAWLLRMENALDRYVTLEPDIKNLVIKYMLYVKGEGGDKVDSVFGQLYNLLNWEMIQ
ncbi:DUF87 domain-containing protein [Ruminococcus sp.]|uniref:ATP-binding protein n=1 Tax=Ruminococcus sp. TaxID=41978 RepID=UPI0025D6ADD0|nr:DUF87 domain-containing protein [Ruminococcus sp.]MBR1433106.1 DUF87 domain-containing protein [Ruminococcus sp.]